MYINNHVPQVCFLSLFAAITGVTTIEPTTTISTKFIGSAVERTNRPINKSTILGNLESLLTREVEAGNFMKVGEDTYSLPPLPPSTYQPPTSIPMSLSTPTPLPGSNITLSHHNVSDAINHGQTSMMTVPMTPLIPSAPLSTHSSSSPQLEQVTAELNQGTNNVQTQSNQKLQFSSIASNPQAYSLTHPNGVARPQSNSNTMIGIPGHQFPMTSMIGQAGRLTPDSRSSPQQGLQACVSTGLVNSPEIPSTPPPLTIQPLNQSSISSSSLANFMPPAGMISTPTSASLGVGGDLSIAQTTNSSDLNSQVPIQILPQQAQNISLQQQGNPNPFVSQPYASQNKVHSATPPPCSPSLNTQSLATNQSEQIMNLSVNAQTQNASQYLNREQGVLSKEEKSDEEKKNDLINEKLFKLNSFQGGKGQVPTRQKSIEKGGDGQKTKTKKVKERQPTCNLPRENFERKSIENTPAIIKQEVLNDHQCIPSMQGKDSLTSMDNVNKDGEEVYQYQVYQGNGVNIQGMSNANNMDPCNVKVEPYPNMASATLDPGIDNSFGIEGAQYNLNSNNGPLQHDPQRIVNQSSVGGNEFVVPGDLAATSSSSSRLEMGIRKKVSAIFSHIFISIHTISLYL